MGWLQIIKTSNAMQFQDACPEINFVQFLQFLWVDAVQSHQRTLQFNFSNLAT